MRHLRSFCAALLLFAAHGGAAADLQQQLGGCRSIADDTQRLACYDALGAPAAAAQAAPPPAAAPSAAAPAAAPDPVRSFGAESVKKPVVEDQVERIESRLLAAVEETSRGQRYRLENGQTWLNIDDRGRYINAPAGSAVAVERNFMGSYWMRFGERGTSVRVRRVE